jgi:DNA-binding HxlR family transcriptional regulator
MVHSNGPRRGRPAPHEGDPVPVAEIVESVVGCKWSVRLLQLCAEEHTRPSALLRACPGLSAKVMNERLRKMTRYGILRRVVFGEKPPVEVEYRLTEFGRRFLRILDEVRRLQEAVDAGAVRYELEAWEAVPAASRNGTGDSSPALRHISRQATPHDAPPRIDLPVTLPTPRPPSGRRSTAPARREDAGTP